MEKERAPGTARFGNFINYYDFNPPSRRINIIPERIFSVFSKIKNGKYLHVIDVGCNAGDLTTCLHDAIISVPDSTIQGLNETQSTLRVLGVDLDSQLILRCKESHKDKHNIEFKQVDIMKAEGREQISLYMQNYSITNFDIVTSFSITMWIHLNHGDNGLKEYLKYLSDICGGFLVIEPQPWKCYRNAERRMKKDGCDSFDWYKKLTWRSDVTQEITDYLTNECKMQLEETFGLTEDWQRPVCLFRKTC